MHYVYRITNKVENKHYYGSRTSKTEPKLDLGVKYFSSSSDKDFIQDQKDNFKNYKYKIIKKFETRKEALNLEIKLHNKFNVGVNESFYNKVKQTSNGWDVTGIKQTQEHILKISKYNLGNKYRFGKKHSKDSKNKIGISNLGKIRSEEFKIQRSEYTKGVNNPMFGKMGSEHPKHGYKMNAIQINSVIERTTGYIWGGNKLCEHCNKVISAGNYKRWHGKNCKVINKLN